MALLNSYDFRRPTGLSENELELIKKFLQGSVYCWVKNRKEEVFAARDLVGGENFNWSGTPLIVLYEKHKNKDKSDEEAIEDAGKDLGWILKLVLHEDRRTFTASDAGMAKGYKWNGIGA
jgi:hypothetical protein